ncbi:hypothetical protein CGMCC3_g2458 [Colletotrichum fructicola]|nr:uncharacterized protein CGMCC3_g2458 [Colletotrichum fructicola]KAE9581577.1 hypothetical protein CGMCC3_g2458 [Colletotrichum fructicola]
MMMLPAVKQTWIWACRPAGNPVWLNLEHWRMDNAKETIVSKIQKGPLCFHVLGGGLKEVDGVKSIAGYATQ